VLCAAAVPHLRPIFQGSPEMVGVVLAAGAMFAVGLIDDVRDMSAPAKMAGQVLAASILYFSGVTMYELKIPLAGFFVLTPGIVPLITAAWVIALTNAVNLIDGLDGLAAGVVAIGGGALAVYGIRLMGLGLLPSDNIGPLVAVIACGICLGFLPFNFNPARIFMGDAGAMFLGLLLATTTITVGGRTADPFSGQTYFYFAPLAIPLVILGVPIFDTAFSFVRRLVKRQSFAQADHEHLHHRLMRMGHGPRRAVVILWLWTALLSAIVLLPTFTDRGNSLVPLAVLTLALLLYIYFHPGVRSARAAEAPGETGEDDDAAEVVDLEPRRAARRGR
jgi:UDP-GlcNAc:undecaprenyl-phosphate GlcNAc-1-phosphate transferase